MYLQMLGASGLQVTPIGLGLAALGRPGYINLGHFDDLGGNHDIRAVETQSHAVLDAAWAAGVRYFDVARSYGSAESFLGTWLRARNISPGSVTVGSKWGYTYSAGWRVDAEIHELKEHSQETFERQWEKSHTLLGDCLRLYQIHSVTTDDDVLEDRELLLKLGQLKRRHGVRVGLSLSGPKQGEVLLRALEIEYDGLRLFDSVQATWNLLERSAGNALAEASAAGLGIIVKEVLANGRLTPRNNDPRFRPELALLVEQAERLGTTLDAMAIAAVLAQPWADVVLSGATTTFQLMSNVSSLEVAWDEEAAVALANVVEPPVLYWEQRSRLPWN